MSPGRGLPPLLVARSASALDSEGLRGEVPLLKSPPWIRAFGDRTRYCVPYLIYLRSSGHWPWAGMRDFDARVYEKPATAPPPGTYRCCLLLDIPARELYSLRVGSGEATIGPPGRGENRRQAYLSNTNGFAFHECLQTACARMAPYGFAFHEKGRNEDGRRERALCLPRFAAGWSAAGALAESTHSAFA